jgi:chromosome segregation ATPase
MKAEVTYKKMKPKLSNHAQNLLEKRVAEARRVKGLEEELASLKFQLSQLTDLLENERKKYRTLENEASKLRGARSIKTEKIVKADSLKVTRSAEYQNLSKRIKLLESESSSSNEQLTELKSAQKILCRNISRALKVSLEEALITKAKRDMYLRKIKEVQEGRLEGLAGIIAVMTYSTNDEI